MYGCKMRMMIVVDDDWGIDMNMNIEEQKLAPNPI
jgi:hypothetical protein